MSRTAASELWIDESARSSVNGVIDVIAAVRAESNSHRVDRLEELRFPDQRYLHWRDEPANRRVDGVHPFQ